MKFGEKEAAETKISPSLLVSLDPPSLLSLQVSPKGTNKQQHKDFVERMHNNVHVIEEYSRVHRAQG